jgi:hypothetical protein
MSMAQATLQAAIDTTLAMARDKTGTVNAILQHRQGTILKDEALEAWINTWLMDQALAAMEGLPGYGMFGMQRDAAPMGAIPSRG